jgi:DNA-binding response OmpR family regulator
MGEFRSEHTDAEATLADGEQVGGGRMVLLVDHDVESRRHARHLLELQGMEVIQASNGMAALELIQRLPQRFSVVLTEIDLPDLPGSVVTRTLRIFRPDLRTLCMSSRAAAGLADGRRCLTKPLQGADLQAALGNGRDSAQDDEGPELPEDQIARARARYAALGDLVEAAIELARARRPED